MKRLLLVIATIALLLGLAAPAVLAAGPTADQQGQVLIGINGNITLPTGEQADAVVVANGDAIIHGQVRSLIVVNGAAILEGATAQDVFVANGTVTLGAGTSVSGDVRTVNSTVTRDPGAMVTGTVRAADADLIAFAAVIAPAIVLFLLGFALVTIAGGLALAALAARQVRTAEALISREPAETFVFGLAGLVVIPLVAILAMATIVGAPLGLAILLMVWPAAAIAGYLVAGIWIGEWLLYRGDRPRPERPYLASVVGLIALQIAGLIPFVDPIASLFGFGAVLLLAWRTFRSESARTIPMPPTSQPMGA
jgi:hypothetical protein